MERENALKSEEEIIKRLIAAYYAARKGKRKNGEVAIFEMDLALNILVLAKEIKQRIFHPSPGIAFPVEEPVIREVFAAPFRDRVVHHFLCDLTMEKFDKTFVSSSFSCRKEKGTLYGVEILYKDMQRITNNWTEEAWVIKFDLQGFFMSLRREYLWEVVLAELEKFYPIGGEEFEIVKYLWREIIMDDPIIGVRLKGQDKTWSKVPKSKSLFWQPKRKGIVIGNLTSQLLSNIFLNKLDQFIVNELGYKKCYGRYVDDFYIIVKDRDFAQLKEDVKLIEEFASGMGLTLHPKKRYIQKVDKGVSFLGARIYPGRILVGKRVKGNFYKKYFMDDSSAEEITSYLSLMQNFRSWNLIWKNILKISLQNKKMED